MWTIEYLTHDKKEEWIQKIAWRLVRSAEDRFGAGRGVEKLNWCVDRMWEILKRSEERDFVEDYVRAAFVNLKTEQRATSVV